MTKQEKTAIKRIRKTFKLPEAKNLLTKGWKIANQSSGIDSMGFCYIATEALFHMLGGKDNGYKPVCGKLLGGTHWWLINKSGIILDPTQDQLWCIPEQMYDTGCGCGFQNGYEKPSKRATKLIELTLTNSKHCV